MTDRDPLERLSSAYRIEVDPETRNRHLAAVHEAVVSAPALRSGSRFGLRRRAAAVAAAIVVAAPVGMAVAAENAVPGDALYPVKELTERVRLMIDPRIEAMHRVDEAERLVARRAPRREIRRAIDRAESATAQLDDPDLLVTRLGRIRERALQEERETSVNGPQTDRSDVPKDSGGDTSGGPKSGAGEGSGSDSGRRGAGEAEGDHVTSTTQGRSSDDSGNQDGRSSGQSEESTGNDAMSPPHTQSDSGGGSYGGDGAPGASH